MAQNQSKNSSSNNEVCKTKKSYKAANFNVIKNKKYMTGKK